MSESDSTPAWAANYEQQCERERVEARGVMAAALDALAKLGAAEARIAYDGYGDSGMVEGVSATGANGEIELPGEIRNQLVTAAEFLLPDGWENNSGAFGELVLDVANRRLTREHNWRVEETEYDEEVWGL